VQSGLPGGQPNPRRCEDWRLASLAQAKYLSGIAQAQVIADLLCAVEQIILKLPLSRCWGCGSEARRKKARDARVGGRNRAVLRCHVRIVALLRGNFQPMSERVV